MWLSLNANAQAGDQEVVDYAPNSEEATPAQPEGYDDVSARRIHPSLAAPLLSWWR